jgi:hypothetical protein
MNGPEAIFFIFSTFALPAGEDLVATLVGLVAIAALGAAVAVFPAPVKALFMLVVEVASVEDLVATEVGLIAIAALEAAGAVFPAPVKVLFMVLLKRWPKPSELECSVISICNMIQIE